jgi:DNA polymerase III subunit delta'
MLQAEAFAGIVGHAAARRVLGHAILRPHHAYLIQGVEGLGAHVLAEKFVRALLGMEAGQLLASHPDLIEIGREVGEDGVATGLTVGVEAVRRARVRLSQRPVVASRLVAYVPEADRLGIEGANVLLKSMEEPVCPCTFVLVAHDEGRIPATVKSRLVALTLGPVSAVEMDAWLRAEGVAEAERREAVRLSGGRPGFAKRWLADPEERKQLAEVARTVDAVLRASSPGQAMAALDAEFRKADAADDTTRAWERLCDLLAYAVRDQLADSPTVAMRLARAVVAARRHVGGPVSPRVWFEVTLLKGSAVL